MNLAPRLEHEFQLAHRRVEIAQREQSGRVDPRLVVKTPVFVEELVVGVDVVVQRLDAAHVMLGHRAHGRRIEDRALDALGVHQRQARLALQILRAQRLERVTLGRLAGLHLAQHLFERARPVGHVDGVVESGDQPAAGQQTLLAVGQRHRGDRAPERFLGQVTGDRVSRLVDVVVAVEELNRKVCHEIRVVLTAISGPHGRCRAGSAARSRRAAGGRRARGRCARGKGPTGSSRRR